MIVTATDLPRLMACNGSRLMGGSTPPVNADDTVRAEGIAAHWLISQIYTGQCAALDMVNKKAPNGVYITAEMVEFLYDYITSLHGCEIEFDTSYSGIGWQVNGRCDRFRYDAQNAHLYIDDLKYGWGIVEPHGNWTLISHVVGWIRCNPYKPVRTATMTIYQPRPHHYGGRIRPWNVGEEQIHAFFGMINNTLSNPSDILITGAHCYKCPALATCPAANQAQMNAIEASEHAFTDKIDNATLSFQLDHLKRAEEMIAQRRAAFEELATHRLRKGEIIQHYNLEQDLTNRQWQEHVTPEILQVLTGKDLTKKQLITPAQAEKAGASKEFVTSFCERRNKGVKLVRMDVNAKAQKLFNTSKRK